MSMTTCINRSITLKTVLIIGLSVIILSITGVSISCNSSTSVPTTTGSELPTTPSPGESPTAPPQIEVAIEDFAFTPATLNIPAGTTVIWYNHDAVIHTVTARDNSFDSGSLSEDDTFSHTFETKGSFDYYCIIHPYMTGEVTVE